MRRRTRTRIAAAVIAVPVALILCVVLYLELADLSGWRDTVAGFLSDKLGREVRITGAFAADVGLTTRLTAEGVTLANPDWSADATMASIERLTIEIDLLSLVRGPLTIRDVKIENVAVLLKDRICTRANLETKERVILWITLLKFQCLKFRWKNRPWGPIYSKECKLGNHSPRPARQEKFGARQGLSPRPMPRLKLPIPWCPCTTR